MAIVFPTSPTNGDFATSVNNANHTHRVTIPGKTTTSVGSGTQFDNRPTFYALAFIIKR